jgi:hypothetical protein
MLLALTGLLLGGCTSAPRHDNAEKEIIALERRALDNWSLGKTTGYAEAGEADLTYCDDIGAQTRIDGLDAVRKYLASLEGKVPVHEYEMVNPKVQVYGDIGILTIQYHPSTLEGQPLRKWKATSVYRYSGGSWHMVHAHWSTIKEQ